MDRTDQIRGPAPKFSIIIPVYNDWAQLEECLRSLTQQTGPSFEVLVVDDGSGASAPDSIRDWGQRFNLTILRKNHEGISAARNTGIRASRGPVLLFVDADCQPQPGCVSELDSCIQASPKKNFFQLRLIGNSSTQTGRAEELRLATLQGYTIQSDGHIRYLNTAAFAVRRRALDAEAGLFNPLAIRGEDTLLLVNLIQRLELPLFVPQAVVLHSVPSSFLVCLRKDIRSAYLQSGTYAFIANTGVKVRMSNRARIEMLRSMWRAAGQKSIGRTAWFLLLARQLLERTVSVTCQLLEIYPMRPKEFKAR